MNNRVLIAILATLVVIIQVQLLGAWPVLGAQPHLIALGAVLFCALERFELGLVWILVGSLFVDSLLSARFGVTTMPLLIVYGSTTVLLRRYVHDVPIWGYALLAIIFVGFTELPLTIGSQFDGWQLVRDAFVGALLILPLAVFATHQTSTRRAGLRI